MACAPLLTEDNLLRFRTKACLRLAQGSCSFGLDRCQYCHSSVWTRRPPFFPLGAYHQQRNGQDRHPATVALLRYLPVACSNVIVTDGSITAVPCPRGQNCPFSHSRDEIVYHPLLYKTEECEEYETSRCGVYYCWKTHNAKERRKPAKLKLGVVKGIEVQVFYPGITVVQVNAPGQKSTFGGGKLSEALKSCNAGQGRAVSRRAQGRPSKRDFQQVPSNCLFPCRNLMKTSSNLFTASETAFASVYGASAPMHVRQPPQSPARSSLVSVDHIDRACGERRLMVDTSVLMDLVTAETGVRRADLQDIENVIRGPFNGSDKCTRMMAETFRRSNVTADTNSDTSARAPPVEGDESAYQCASIGNTAAFLAMMVLQANRALAKKGETTHGDFRAEDSYGKTLAEIASEEGSTDVDVLGYLGSAAVSPSQYSCTGKGDENCTDLGQLVSEQSYAVTRANSDGELPLSSGFRRQQGSEHSCSRSLSTSRQSADCISRGTVVPGSHYTQMRDEGPCLVGLASCGGTWIKESYESGAQAWSDTSSDGPTAGEYAAHARSQQHPSCMPGFHVGQDYSGNVIKGGLSPDLFTSSSRILVDNNRASAPDLTRLPFHMRTGNDIDRGKANEEGREDADLTEIHHGQMYGTRGQGTCSVFPGSSGHASEDELSRVQDLLTRQDVRSASTAACPLSIARGQHDDGGSGELDDVQGCLEEAGARLRQAVNALDFIREGQRGEIRKDLMMSVARELLKRAVGGEVQKADQTQIPAWYPTGVRLEQLPHVRTTEDAEGHTMIMAGRLPASRGVSDAGALWSSVVKKRLDVSPPVADASHNTVWW